MTKRVHVGNVDLVTEHPDESASVFFPCRFRERKLSRVLDWRFLPVGEPFVRVRVTFVERQNYRNYTYERRMCKNKAIRCELSMLRAREELCYVGQFTYVHAVSRGLKVRSREENYLRDGMRDMSYYYVCTIYLYIYNCC